MITSRLLKTSSTAVRAFIMGEMPERSMDRIYKDRVSDELPAQK
jgi:hypothetical protein